MSPSQERKPSAPFCWQEKNNLRHIRVLVKKNQLKRSEGRNILDVFRAITEMMSDAASDVLVGTYLSKKIASYSLMGHSTVKRTLNIMTRHKIIKLKKIRDNEGMYVSSEIKILKTPQKEINLDEPTRGPETASGGKSTAGQTSAGESHGGDSDPLIEENNNNSEENDEIEESRSLSSTTNTSTTSQSTPTTKIKNKQRIKTRTELQNAVKQIIEHLAEITGRAFDPQSNATVDLRKRLRDGALVEDCMLIIDHRHALWFKDARMTGYLRPQTLFSKNHYDDYLQLAREWSQSGRPTLHPSAHRDAEEIKPSGPRREAMIRQWQQLSK